MTSAPSPRRAGPLPSLPSRRPIPPWQATADPRPCSHAPAAQSQAQHTRRPTAQRTSTSQFQSTPDARSKEWTVLSSWPGGRLAVSGSEGIPRHVRLVVRVVCRVRPRPRPARTDVRVPPAEKHCAHRTTARRRNPQHTSAPRDRSHESPTKTHTRKPDFSRTVTGAGGLHTLRYSSFTSSSQHAKISRAWQVFRVHELQQLLLEPGLPEHGQLVLGPLPQDRLDL